MACLRIRWECVCVSRLELLKDELPIEDRTGLYLEFCLRLYQKSRAGTLQSANTN